MSRRTHPSARASGRHRVLALAFAALGLSFAMQEARSTEGAPPASTDVAAGERSRPAAEAVSGARAPEAPSAASPAPAPIEQLAAGPVSAVRPSLLPLVEPLWSDLSEAQRAALAPFEPEWNAWPVPEKKSWVALADRLPRMSEAKRETALRRIAEWAKLSPEQRRLARANYRLAKERPADARVVEWENYRSMTQEQRTVLRQVGSTSNTAAGHARALTGLAKQASQPLPRRYDPARLKGLVPASTNPQAPPGR